MTELDQEFITAFVFIGGITFAGLLIVMGLTMIGIGLFKKIKKKNLVNELYEDKERSNGQHKGGARGKW